MGTPIKQEEKTLKNLRIVQNVKNNKKE